MTQTPENALSNAVLYRAGEKEPCILTLCPPIRELETKLYSSFSRQIVHSWLISSLLQIANLFNPQ